MKLITVYAVSGGDYVLALFRSKAEAIDYRDGHMIVTLRVDPWQVPAETFEFEGNDDE